MANSADDWFRSAGTKELAAQAFGGNEPRAAIAISRCVRSQRENRRDRITFSAAVRREERPFVRDAAR